MHDILRAIIGAMKALDEKTRDGLLKAIGEHEAARPWLNDAGTAPPAAVPAPSPAGTALAVPDAKAVAIAALKTQLAALEGAPDGA